MLSRTESETGHSSGRLVALLKAATWAPSGDNMQPWRFAVDVEAGRIEMQVDEARDPSPMNAGQRMARVAVGAALENLLATASHNGWEVKLHPTAPPILAVVEVLNARDDPGIAQEVIAKRVTNRRLYDGRPLDPEVLARLGEATPSLDGVRTYWFTDRARLPVWADLVSRADAVMFGEPSMRRAFFRNVCFDAGDDKAVAEGLSPAVLEMSWFQRHALRLVARLPDWAAAVGGFARQVAGHTRRLVQSASGLCLLTAPDGREATDVAVGRAMQRAWLALTAAGLAVQPMMSLLVLENARENGGAALRASLGQERLQALGDEFRRLAPEIGGARPAFLLRFGYAPPPGARTGRRPLEAVVGEAW